VRTTSTGESERYTVPSLPVGHYEVEADLPRFKSELQTGITLVVSQQAVLDFRLQVGEVKQQVTV